MEYLTVREAAEKWNISPRMVQQFCVTGRIPGAQKFGRAWAVPADAEKPQDPRFARKRETQAQITAAPDYTNLMPLMNTPFQPGHCLAAVKSMEEGPQRDIAWAEYYYFMGQAEKAARAAGEYLTSPDTGARLSACLIYAYANLTLHQIQHARFALNEVQMLLAAKGEHDPQLKAAAAFVAATSAVLLHLSDPVSLLRVLRRYLKKSGSIFIQDEDDGANLVYPYSKFFDRAFAIWADSEESGDRCCGRKIPSYLSAAGYKHVSLVKCGVSDAGLTQEKRTALWDIYFNYHLCLAAQEYMFRNAVKTGKMLEEYEKEYDYYKKEYDEGKIFIQLGFLFFIAQK